MIHNFNDLGFWGFGVLGYGTYDWNSSRSYSGYWLNKQHGLGVLRDQEKGSVKYSLYENGERRLGC